MSENVKKENKISKAKIIIPIAAVLVLAGVIALIVIPKKIYDNKKAKYDKAAMLLENESYDEAITAFGELDDFLDSAYMKEKAKTELKHSNEYQQAQELLDSGDYSGSYEAFLALKDYKDSEAKASEIYEEYLSLKGMLRRSKIGDDFAIYKDNDTVKWRVVAREGDQVMLAEKFPAGYEPVTLKKSELKSYIYKIDFDLYLEYLKQSVVPEISDDITAVFIPNEQTYKDYIKNSKYKTGDNYATLMFIGQGPAWNFYKEEGTVAYYNCGYIGTDKKKSGECPNKVVAMRLFIWVDAS